MALSKRRLQTTSGLIYKGKYKTLKKVENFSIPLSVNAFGVNYLTHQILCGDDWMF